MAQTQQDIINMGQTTVRVTYYTGTGDDRTSNILEVPGGGCKAGTFDESVLISSHFKSLVAKGILKLRVRVS